MSTVPGPPVAGPPVPGPPAEVPWSRLDSRMLLVNPVQELIRFFPLVIGVVVLGSSGDGDWWQLLGILVPVTLGVVRFLSTRYRITPVQIELKRGLLGTKVLTARLDRVRAVELTSSPIHRVLGLAKVEIGTASAAKQDEEKFALDALALPLARDLRAALLHRVAEVEGVPESVLTGGTAPDGGAPAPGWPATPAPDHVLLRLDPSWVRYAPLTSSGNVVAAGVLALLGQFAERARIDVVDPGEVESVVTRLSLGVVVPLLLLAFLLLGAVFAVLGYLVTNWGFTLSRDARGRSFHVRRGLLTSTETSLERERVRGLEVGEPLGLRLVGAGRLAAIVTGLSRSERSSTALVPPAPTEVVRTVGADVLGDRSPLDVPLRPHGPAARRRRWTRALLGALVLPGALAAVVVLADLSWWLVLPSLVLLPLAAWVAEDRYRGLGHALTEDYLVVRSGTFRGRRDLLQRSGIIGWNLQQSWFQRRAGLVTLVATTAAGQQAYLAVDVPEQDAVALAHATVPGLLAPFLH